MKTLTKGNGTFIVEINKNELELLRMISFDAWEKNHSNYPAFAEKAWELREQFAKMQEELE